MCFSEGTWESDIVFINEAPHETKQGSTSLINKGRLNFTSVFRTSIGALQFIINTISNRDIIPFVHTPRVLVSLIINRILNTKSLLKVLLRSC